MKRSARMAAFLLAAALSAAPCLAEFTPVEVPQATNAPAAPEAMENVPQITEKGLTLGNNSVKYPEITGMADENIQQQVNDAILQAGKIENRLSRMAVLMSSPVPLTVTYSAALADDVLSVAILSSGALETERATQEWAAVNIDLRTGQEITFGDLFTDADEARAKMEETIADEILPDMSAHLAAAELLPLPDVFSLTEYGLTLHYPIRRFETLSERAGTITFLWSELADVLDLSEDSVLTRLGVGKHLKLAADAKETYLAKLRDKTVGRLMLGSGNTTDTGVILDLSLDEPHRGRRFGQQLLGQAVCTERRRGAKRLAATVPEQNADALRFFRENGFVLKEHTMDGAYLEMDIEVRPLP